MLTFNGNINNLFAAAGPPQGSHQKEIEIRRYISDDETPRGGVQSSGASFGSLIRGTKGHLSSFLDSVSQVSIFECCDSIF